MLVSGGVFGRMWMISHPIFLSSGSGTLTILSYYSSFMYIAEPLFGLLCFNFMDLYPFKVSGIFFTKSSLCDMNNIQVSGVCGVVYGCHFVAQVISINCNECQSLLFITLTIFESLFALFLALSLSFGPCFKR